MKEIREIIMINDKKLVYLAGPYYDDDPKVIKKRFNLFNKVAATLISKKEVYVFSPISHSHPIMGSKAFNKDFFKLRHWMPFDLSIMNNCDELNIIDIEGWDKSEGVKLEIEYAKLNGLPIKMVTPRGRTYKYGV